MLNGLENKTENVLFKKQFEILENEMQELTLGLLMEIEKKEDERTIIVGENDYIDQAMEVLYKLEMLSEKADSETITDILVFINQLNEDLVYGIEEMDRHWKNNLEKTLLKQLIRARAEEKEEGFEEMILLDEPIDYTERDVIGF